MSIKARAILLVALCLLALATVAGCDASEAEADIEERWEYERVKAGLYGGHGSLFMLTDTETDQQWVVVHTDEGVGMAPYGGDEE